jgi:hypothetical protein
MTDARRLYEKSGFVITKQDRGGPYEVYFMERPAAKQLGR